MTTSFPYSVFGVISTSNRIPRIIIERLASSVIRYLLTAFVLVLTLAIFSCENEIIPAPYFPRSDHEAYIHSLQQANLTRTALGREWERAGRGDVSPYQRPARRRQFANSWRPYSVGSGALRPAPETQSRRPRWLRTHPRSWNYSSPRSCRSTG